MTRRALLALAVVLLSLPVLGGAPPAAGQDEQPAVSLSLADRSAWAGDGEPLTLDVAVDGDVGDTTVRVRVHRALQNVTELTDSLDGDEGTVVFASDPVPTAELPELDDGTRRVEVRAEDLGDPGVHPVVVEIREPNGTVIDVIRTPAVRLGTDDDPLAAPTLTLLVDVAAEPSVQPDGRRALGESELARAERLAALLEDPTLPATMLAVPDTIDALTASDDPRAQALLDALAPAGANRRAVRMPYVATSARSLTQAAIGTALGRSFDAGTPVLTDRFGTAPDPTIWPDDDVGRAAGELLSTLGVRHLLLDSTATTRADPPTAPLQPLGPRPIPSEIAGGLSGIQVDGPTSHRLLDPAPDRTDAAHLTVAELLLRDRGQASAVAVRVDDVPADSRLSTALDLLTADDAPVALAPLDLPAVDDTAPLGSPVPEDEPDLTPIADEYRAAADALDMLEGVVGADTPGTIDLELQLVTALATDLTLDERRALLDAVETAARTGVGSIEITGQTDLNLTSRSGSLPVGVANGNDFPIRVMIRISSDRLRFPEGEELLVEAEPGVTRIDIPVEALATGSVPVFVQLRTPDGTALLDDRQLNVRSTAFSGVGLALGLGALVVLGAWWFRSWRRHRNEPADPEEPADGPSGSSVPDS
ncbi:MAG: DUF6049 family protein [Acidimicrobiales bacterium]|nr:DUF6049 family protein [Acidimicrobiales bacterium]